MKWTSANSSDRKSVFYTSEDSNSIIASAKEHKQHQQHQKSKGNGVTDSSSSGCGNSLFTFKMGGDDETTESQNSKSSSNNSSANNSIERHNGSSSTTGSNGKSNSNGTDLKRYLKNFMLFSNLEIESEKKCRDEQLSKIVKALMLFENKLRKEQEIIEQKLCEKDRVINRQMHTISNMKVKLGAEHQFNDGDGSSVSNETAEYCPMCRKKYYYRASKSTATQTHLKGFTNNVSDDYSSIQSVEYMSSSEEQEVLLSPNPFTTARRSKKYTSKKSYKDYLQTRPHHNNNNSTSGSGGADGSTRNNTNNNNKSMSVLSQPKDFLVNGSGNNNSDKNNNTIEHTNVKEVGISKSSSCGGAAKFSLIMNDIHGIKQQKQQSCDDTHSLKINRMHGISLTTLNISTNEVKEKDTMTTKNCHNDDNDSNNNHHNHIENGDDNQTAIKVTCGDDKKEFNSNSNNNSCSKYDHHYGDAATRKKYCDEGLEVKQKIATRDDWYSDIEENDTAIGVTTKSPYGNIVSGVSNSVLECVNQILLQQSMDEYMEKQNGNKPKESTTKESATNTATTTTSSTPTRSNRRVHFSTKNSMVQIKALPRHNRSRHHQNHHDHNHHHHHHNHHHHHDENAEEDEENHSQTPSDDDLLNTTYENQSTYSNEYDELIGSSRTYVDMDTTKESNSFKPKLPPKPDNLMKLQQIAKQRQFVQDQIYNKKNNSDYELNESEPDYASISEIQDTIKSVKVVTAEIHNDADDDDEDGCDNEYSEIKEVPTPTLPDTINTTQQHTLPASLTTTTTVMINEDDSFADVPKLPNVYKIIPGIESSPTSPKKESPNNNNKCIIGHDNYITKSPMKKKLPLAFASVNSSSSNSSKKEKEKSSVLTEMNNVNKKQQQSSSAPTTAPPPVPLKHQQTIKIMDEKIQQEFDWYNLDAEYTKTDIVITPQIENLDEMYHFDDENAANNDDDAVVKVEYNLEDFEYESSSANGIEIETNNNNFTTVIKINESHSSSASTSSSSASSTSELLLQTPLKKPTTTTANLMELAETPKIDFRKSNKIRYEKFLNESGLISKPLLLTSKKKFYAGSFV